jgi:SAM-dependent methyltransferase
MATDNFCFKNYCSLERWSSYWHQLDEILKLKPASVLEVGIGDGVLCYYLKHNAGIKYTTMDVNKELAPDILGSIESIPLSDGSYDLVCAFEVLEHLPFDRLSVVLAELSRVSKKYIVISLPHWGRHFSIDIRMPLLKRIKGMMKFNLFPAKHEFNGQHYWEVGKKNYPLSRVRDSIKAAKLELLSHYVAFESPYHHFFIMRKC